MFPQISASDPDLGLSGAVRYSLVQDPNDHYKSFTIDPFNGTIYTTTSFDREELGLYKLTVRATDQPTSGQARYVKKKLFRLIQEYVICEKSKWNDSQ